MNCNNTKTKFRSTKNLCTNDSEANSFQDIINHPSLHYINSDAFLHYIILEGKKDAATLFQHILYVQIFLQIFENSRVSFKIFGFFNESIHELVSIF